jgi:hypothetical protein
MIGVSHFKLKDSFLGLPNSPFSSKNLIFVLDLFILISNEINFLQVLCRPLEYLFFSFMKVKIIGFIHMDHVLPMAQKSQKFYF